MKTAIRKATEVIIVTADLYRELTLSRPSASFPGAGSPRPPTADPESVLAKLATRGGGPEPAIQAGRRETLRLPSVRRRSRRRRKPLPDRCRPRSAAR